MTINKQITPKGSRERQSGILDAQFNARKMGRSRMHIEADHSKHALAAAYRQCEARVTKLQILSIIVDYSRNGKFKFYSLKLQNTNCFKLENILFRMEEGNPYQLFLDTVLA